MDVPLPGGRDLNKALRIYIAGRNRVWTANEKREAAGSEAPRQPTGQESTPSVEAEVRIGVPVPDSLQFHRGPGTWRGEMPGGRRRQRGRRAD